MAVARAFEKSSTLEYPSGHKLLGVLALAAVGVWLWRGSMRASTPVAFQQLTYREGDIQRARLQPDSNAFTYTAKWSGEPLHTFAERIGDREAHQVPLAAGSELAAISPTGELLRRQPREDAIVSDEANSAWLLHRKRYWTVG